MVEQIEQMLRKLGLEEKEAKVYTAALQLGPSPVQKIAKRADVPRATTYLVLDILKAKGLISIFQKGKKTFFVAENPNQLAVLIEEQAQRIKQQQELVKNIIPQLISLGQFQKSARPVVRYYEGSEAVGSFIRDAFSSGNEEVVNFLDLDKAEETLAQTGFPIEKVRDRRRKLNLKSRVIYTSRSGAKEGYSTDERQAKFVPEHIFPFQADVAIRGDRTMLVPYGMPLRGVVIYDKAIADSMKTIFELVWHHISELKDFDKNQ